MFLIFCNIAFFQVNEFRFWLRSEIHFFGQCDPTACQRSAIWGITRRRPIHVTIRRAHFSGKSIVRSLAAHVVDFPES
jgi:hypothetical protein